MILTGTFSWTCSFSPFPYFSVILKKALISFVLTFPEAFVCSDFFETSFFLRFIGKPIKFLSLSWSFFSIKQPTITSVFGWIHKHSTISLYFLINISPLMLTGKQTLTVEGSLSLLEMKEICGSGLKINLYSSVKKKFCIMVHFSWQMFKNFILIHAHLNLKHDKQIFKILYVFLWKINILKNKCSWNCSNYSFTEKNVRENQCP